MTERSRGPSWTGGFSVPAARRFTRRAVVASAPPLRRVVAERDALRERKRELEARTAQWREQQQRLLPRYAAEQHRYLFVMTYGRSGSTLLQAVLNSIPGVLIRGENRGVVYRLHQFHGSAVRDAQWVGPPGVRQQNPWFGIRDYPAEVALEDLRRLVLDTLLRPEKDTREVGFKEIRWYQDDLADYVAFLRELFPGARFVVNTRRLDDVAHSGWWRDHADAYEKLERIEAQMLDVARRLGEDAFRVHYDDYAADPGQLEELFDWLGAPFDEDRVHQVMQRRYSP